MQSHLHHALDKAPVSDSCADADIWCLKYNSPIQAHTDSSTETARKAYICRVLLTMPIFFRFKMDAPLCPSSYYSPCFQSKIENANDPKAGCGNTCFDVPNQTDFYAENSTEETPNSGKVLNFGNGIMESPKSWMITRGSSNRWIAEQRPQGFFHDKELGKCKWGSGEHSRTYLI